MALRVINAILEVCLSRCMAFKAATAHVLLEEFQNLRLNGCHTQRTDRTDRCVNGQPETDGQTNRRTSHIPFLIASERCRTEGGRTERR